MLKKQNQSLKDWCIENNSEYLLDEWIDEDNMPLTPELVSKSAEIKVWWRCKNGHNYLARIGNRVYVKSGCPYCSNPPRQILSGYNDLATKYPELVDEFDLEKNAPLTPQTIFPQMNKKVWWKCKEGHSYKQSPLNKIQEHLGCPYCSGRKVLSGYNDLETLYPELAKEWDNDKNSKTPKEFRPQSNTKVWWKCKNGHSWKAVISSRVNGNGCPGCSNQMLVKGENDLETVTPHLLEEWDYEKNNILPSDVQKSTHTKVWWKCKNCGHSWLAEINARYRGTGCPKCAEGQSSSFFEQFLLLSLRLVLGDSNVVSRDRTTIGKELDIFIPSLHAAIEYGSWFWHQNTVESDATRKQLCVDNGIKLITIYDTYPTASDKEVDEYRNVTYYIKEILKSNIGLQREKEIITSVFEELNIELPLNVNWNDLMVCANERSIKVVDIGVDDLQTLFPQVAAEWHPTKNGNLLPTNVKSQSNKCVWWRHFNPKTNLWHEWQDTVSHRTNTKSQRGCPICAGKQVLKGDNDFETVCPEQSKEWHKTKNGELLPSQILSHSNKKYWWQCDECGTEWEARASDRLRGTGCPKCSRKRAWDKRRKNT